MNEAGKYRKILFSMDACYSGSIGEACEGIPGVLFITAANAVETSKADMKDPEMDYGCRMALPEHSKSPLMKAPTLFCSIFTTSWPHKQ